MDIKGNDEVDMAAITASDSQFIDPGIPTASADQVKYLSTCNLNVWDRYGG